MGNQFVWIPCNIDNYAKYNWGYNYNSYVKTIYSVEKIQIKKYGGFYVGRYEAGMSQVKLKDETIKIGKTDGLTGWNVDTYTVSKTTSNSKPTSKAGEIPYFHSDYTTATEMAEKMYNNSRYSSYIDSGLMTGTMWDVMLNYMSNEEAINKSTTNASNDNYYKDLKSKSYWGNYNSNNENVKYKVGQGRYMEIGESGQSTTDFTVSDDTFHYGIRTTASTEDVKKKNLYDVAGNLWEWTQEDVSDGYYMFRGGAFNSKYDGDPVCDRHYSTVSNTYTPVGFRVVLYIK